MITALLVGLSPYLYMPIVSLNQPEATWGMHLTIILYSLSGDQSTIKGFFHHLLRSDYGTFQLGSASTRMYSYFNDLTCKNRILKTMVNGLLSISSRLISMYTI